MLRNVTNSASIFLQILLCIYQFIDTNGKFVEKLFATEVHLYNICI